MESNLANNFIIHFSSSSIFCPQQKVTQAFNPFPFIFSPFIILMNSILIFLWLNLLPLPKILKIIQFRICGPIPLKHPPKRGWIKRLMFISDQKQKFGANEQAENCGFGIQQFWVGWCQCQCQEETQDCSQTIHSFIYLFIFHPSVRPNAFPSMPIDVFKIVHFPSQLLPIFLLFPLKLS